MYTEFSKLTVRELYRALKSEKLKFFLFYRMHNLPTAPYILAIKPFGKTTDWNFKACTRLWPLYKIRWLSPGQAIGLTLPSINPKQFCRRGGHLLRLLLQNTSPFGQGLGYHDSIELF